MLVGGWAYIRGQTWWDTLYKISDVGIWILDIIYSNKVLLLFLLCAYLYIYTHCVEIILQSSDSIHAL